MGVAVFWCDENGAWLDHEGDIGGVFARAILHAQQSKRSDLPIMCSIDVYGDTTVIPPRTDALADEIAVVRDEASEAEARIELGKVLRLARVASSHPRSYLECAGD
jgi:hypothetical protein